MFCRASTLLLIAAMFCVPLHGSSEFGNLPVHFESGVRQSDAQAHYVSRGNGYALFLAPAETVAVVARPDELPSVVRMRFAGAKQGAVELGGERRTAGVTNDFRGNDPARWRTNIPHFERVRMSNVYDGIDVVYYGNQRQIELSAMYRRLGEKRFGLDLGPYDHSMPLIIDPVLAWSTYLGGSFPRHGQGDRG